MSDNQLLQHLNNYRYTATIQSTKKEVNFRPITTGQMKSLLTYENSKDLFVVERMMDDLIQSCVLDSDFRLDDLTLQDRFNLLIDIRKKTKGSTYTFNIKCPECGTTSINSVNLDELVYNPFYDDIDYDVKLTDTITVKLDFIRRGTQKQAIKIVNGIKDLTERQQMVEIATYTYALAMKEFIIPGGVLDNTSIQDKIEFLDNFDEDMYKKITDWYKDNDFGVIFEYQLKCSNCEFSKTDSIPISNFLA